MDAKQYCIWVLVFLSQIGCSTLANPNKERARLHLEIAESLLQNGQRPQALKELLEAEGYDPRDARIQQYLGIAYMSRQRFGESEDHFKKALRLDSSYTEARYNYAVMLIEAKRFDEAIQQLKEAEKDLTYTKPEQVLSSMAYIYFIKRQYHLAIRYAQQALKLRREDCSTLSLLGKVQFVKKQYSDSAQTLDEAIANCRDFAFDEPLYYAGLSYFKMGDRKKALSRLEDLANKFQNSPYVSKARIVLEMLK